MRLQASGDSHNHFFSDRGALQMGAKTGGWDEEQGKSSKDKSEGWLEVLETRE